MSTSLLIRITNNIVFLTPELSFNLTQTSLKGGDYIKFKSTQDIFWEVKVLQVDEIYKEITLEVINYNPQNTRGFLNQPINTPISFIRFLPLSWKSIYDHVMSFMLRRLLENNIVINDMVPYDMSNGLNFQREPQWGRNENNPIIDEIIEEAEINYNLADFNSGYLSFEYKSKELNQVFTLKIENSFLLPEFNAIKSYFSKKINGKKYFSIKIVFTRKNYSVTNIVTTSSEIDAINETLIESIKLERTAKLASIKKSKNQSLFVAHDIYDILEDSIGNSNIFGQSEEEILNSLIETKQFRNTKQLQFLSGSKQSKNQKIRFTIRPNFGFLFFIEGEKQNHFCWEMMNSNATYLWSFNKVVADIPTQFKAMEEEIKVIIENGRESYKNNYSNNIGDKDWRFCTIKHKNINSTFDECFADWKYKLIEKTQ